MQFVHPYFLFGLLAISIPIIIHLFNFHRFRKVYFTNVRFIRQLKQETQRRSQLKHLVILLLRILTVTFLVLSFAQPYLPANRQQLDLNRNNMVCVYLDNSFSMEAVTGSVTLLDIAKNRARELTGTYRSSDEYLLITNDFEAKHNRLLSMEEYLEQLDEITFTPKTRNLSEVLKRLSDERFRNKEQNYLLYIFSDLQKSHFDWSRIPVDSSLNIFVLPLSADQRSNLYIDSCWFDSPVQQVYQQTRLQTRIHNFSDNDLEKIPVRLTVNGSQKGLANLDIPAHESVEVEMPYINYDEGPQLGVVEVDDYPVTYDNQFFVSYQVSSVIPVLSIYQDKENAYLKAVYGKDSTFTYQRSFVGNLDYTSFDQYQLIILDGLMQVSSGLARELTRYMENGGSVAIFPGGESELGSFNAFLQEIKSGYFRELDTNRTKTTYINLDHPLYREVFEEIPENLDLPAIRMHFPVNPVPRSQQEALLKLQNGDVLLSVQPVGKGKIYLFGLYPDDSFSNFQKHSIFVPTLFNLALLSQSQQKLFYTIGEGEMIEIRGGFVQGDQTYRIERPGDDFSFIPEHHVMETGTQIYTHDQIREAGLYELNADGTFVRELAFNYDRKESVMDFYQPDELTGLFADSGIPYVTLISGTNRPFSVVLDELSRGVRLWKWFVVLALVCIAGEVLIIRLWK